ncbi:universal stress protein [Poseidonocella sp. HB161398]|uniref:universal stress protein n=1 Tax=Poseidonocella sp. HB161398 TaxID=2320855 RepID=UPI0014874AF3|nr:universal stress protein [Poseidonocella sp. HB161398]
MKTILLGSDLSLRSERARRRAERLAAAHGAKLVVCTVVDDDLPKQMSGAIMEEAREELSRQSAGGCETEIRVEIGEPVEKLAQVIEEVQPDLVVMGVHRARPIWDMYAGTTVERIVRATPRPVLLVSQAVEDDYARVLCGVDLSHSCAAAARWAAALAPAAEFRSFHALHVPFRGWIAPGGRPEAVAPFLAEARERIAEWWAEEELPAQLPVPEPEAAAVSEAFLRAREAQAPDLIAVGAHARGLFAPTILGSFTETLIRNAPSDILIVRA